LFIKAQDINKINFPHYQVDHIDILEDIYTEIEINFEKSRDVFRLTNSSTQFETINLGIMDYFSSLVTKIKFYLMILGLIVILLILIFIFYKTRCCRKCCPDDLFKRRAKKTRRSNRLDSLRASQLEDLEMVSIHETHDQSALDISEIDIHKKRTRDQQIAASKAFCKEHNVKFKKSNMPKL
jgi:Na+-transporting methylmalonyl-CoA/oxaloacetate decarboxylase gamma subunit